MMKFELVGLPVYSHINIPFGKLSCNYYYNPELTERKVNNPHMFQGDYSKELDQEVGE